jgi:hypothetical protein
MMWTTQVQFLPRLKWKKLIDAEEGLVSRWPPQQDIFFVYDYHRTI